MNSRIAGLAIAVMVMWGFVVGCSAEDDAEGSAPDAGSDASTDVSMEFDTGEDTDVEEEGNCDDLFERWEEFVDANNECQDDSDCGLVGAVFHCNCRPVLGGDPHASGTGINREATDEAQDYFDEFESDECEALREENKICDAAPSENVGCVEGSCKAEPLDCLAF